jgi:hypothetical protein
MPDTDPIQTQTPGQALTGTPVQAPPPGQQPSLAGQPPAQPQAPTPQQAVAARHHALGKVTSFLFGQQRDETGQVIKQPPGTIFRSLLAGAMLGGALGAEGHADGSGVGSFLGGLGRGASGVELQNHQRQQQAQELAMKKQQMTLEQQKFDEEKTQHQATLEHWNMENLARGREADYRDREQLEKENEVDLNVQKWAVDNGAFVAPSIPQNGVPGNGPTMMKAMTKNPTAFNAPAGMGRLLVKKYDFDSLDHDSKNGWTENGKPVDWSKHLTWTVLYVPHNPADKAPISMKASEWTRLYNVKFPQGTDPNAMYNTKAVAPLIGVATQGRKQEREDANESFKSKHDALNATINASRTNVTQLSDEKRELIRQGYAEDSDEVQDVQDKIEDQQKREQDAIGEMHPRERVTKQAPAAQGPAPKPKASQKGPSGPPAGATMKVPGSDGNLHWSDGKNDLGVAQ